ncbi:disrupter of telomere silencing protein [Grosmannia clavigera kw1407]|uniref:Disrupter of telomere silencing protein n=1 Tax=Grosmannia clavigera (strain kw1407 / UAMH 11150) TaxID=655863 RepID=F0XRU9_GROCL|nr:disrupter of telomere silencing protein [Grosmannia clavigera kw1407]EFW99409.1 disrupter of telomere silencing protein [Grosmannia clavigera kw1407]
MPVVLRKRKATESVPTPALKRQATSAVSKSASVAATTTIAKKKAGTKKVKKEPSASSLPTVGSAIDFETFGGYIENNEGEKTTLKALVDASKAGVVLFTYPKASTPGSSGLAIYGLSTDSPKANTTFKTNQNLPYPLLCDPNATLIKAIGLKKEPKGTTRGVFVVDKAGKVLVAESGSPDGTVDVVRKLVQSQTKE